MPKYDMAVIGLGYVGLPLAQQALASGLAVAGFDINPGVVDSLRAGQSHVDDVTDSDVARMLTSGWYVTSDSAVLGEADAVVICVPTPLSQAGAPDLAAVESATRAVAGQLHPGMLVVLESTTYPGTTDELVRPLLELSGLVAGRDFHLAFSPERVDPGNRVWGIRNTPKVVGGCTPSCTERAAQMYARFVDTIVRAKSAREAETAKLLENTYRHVNIALVNEMVKFCHELDIDLWNVIECAASKPFGFQPFYPGPGVGGHCIPIDPNYLSYRVRAELGYPFRFVELAQEVNATMPAYVVRRCAELLNRESKPLNGSNILLLGVTYKRDIADQRESPAKSVALQLLAQGAHVSYHDPYVQVWQLDEHHRASVGDLPTALRASDLVVLLQDHSVYSQMSIVELSRSILDTRGVLSGGTVARL